MPEATLEAPGQQEADIQIPKPVADEKLAATGSKVAAGGPRSKLPETFQKGVAISMFQNSGGINSNWGRYAEARGKLFGLIPNIMDKSSPNDGACDFWDRYEEDIGLAKKLGITGFRLSIEWHRIEPRKGIYDMDAIRRYHKILDSIEAAGMEPNATLHHFVHPDWWDNLGGFEKAENLPAFINFCTLCAREFGQRIKLWATFNEPTCFLVCGWLIGAHPPGKLLSIRLMGRVLFNILKAHAAAYKAMKSIPGAEDIQIGLVHHHVEFMPTSPTYWWVKPLAWWGTFWWGRDTVLRFLQTGHFEWWVPLWGRTIKYQAREKPGLDWWGVNYYARGAITGWCLPAHAPGELMTDMKYTMYPQSLYENIVRGSALGVPMYVTEIGCADRSDDDHLRIANIESSMNQIARAIRDGYDVRGVYYWTLMDNFEWNAGYEMRFGVYKWVPGKPEEQRVLKEGGRLLAKIYATWPDDTKKLKQYCEDIAAEPSEYIGRILDKQHDMHIHPVVWNQGRCISVPPLSPLHLRIGLQDADAEIETELPEIARAAHAGEPVLQAA